MDISVVIPVYNESESVRQLRGELTRVLDDTGRAYEIVFIDDGSTDGTRDVLREIAGSDPRVTVACLRRNFGKAFALSAGFQIARGSTVITMDGDLQDDPAEIPNLLRTLDEGYDLVSGWKYIRRDPLVKVMSSRVFNFFTRLVTGVRLHDFNCGFKAYRREVTERLRIYGDLHRYIPVLANQLGFRVTEVRVQHHPRLHGNSKYKGGRYVRGLLDLLTVVFITRYHLRPLHFLGGIGLIFLSSGVIANTYLSVLWFLGKGPIGDRPLLFLGILLIVVGVQLVFSGLVAEMVLVTSYRDTRNQIQEIGEMYGSVGERSLDAAGAPRR